MTPIPPQFKMPIYFFILKALTRKVIFASGRDLDHLQQFSYKPSLMLQYHRLITYSQYNQLSMVIINQKYIQYHLGILISGKTLLCATLPLIAICRPYLEPTHLARQNLSVRKPLHSEFKFELIINLWIFIRNNQF